MTKEELLALVKEGVSTEVVAQLDTKLNPVMAEVTEKLKALNENKIKAVRGEVDNSEAIEKTVRFFKAIVSRDYAEAKDLSEGVDAAGGYLVPTEFQAEVIRVIPKYGIARRDCRIIPMGGKKKTIPNLAHGVVAYWTEEMVKKTKSTPSFGLVTLTARKLAGLCPTTDELLEDSAIDVYNLLTDLFGEAFGKAEDTALFSGSSPIVGIFNKAGVNVVNLSSTAITGMKADDLLDMIDAVTDFAETNGKFYLHRTVLSVLRKLKDTQGQYIYQAPTASAPGTIWGHSYEKVAVLPKVADDAADKKFLVFGDLRYVLLGDAKKMSVDISKEATIGTTNLFEQDMQAIRVVERLDIQVAVPAALAVGKTKA